MLYYLVLTKAIILAGGHATRLWPITKNCAKPLLQLDERPIIDYIVEELDGLDGVLISTNAKFPMILRLCGRVWQEQCPGCC